MSIKQKAVIALVGFMFAFFGALVKTFGSVTIFFTYAGGLIMFTGMTAILLSAILMGLRFWKDEKEEIQTIPDKPKVIVPPPQNRQPFVEPAIEPLPTAPPTIEPQPIIPPPIDIPPPPPAPQQDRWKETYGTQQGGQNDN